MNVCMYVCMYVSFTLLLIWKQYGAVWYVILSNDFQFLYNITHIFTHFFTHIYFQKNTNNITKQALNIPTTN